MDNTTFPENITYDVDELNRHQVMKHLPILIFYVIILIIGIVGNTLVLLVYKFKLKRSSARVYIISLALADMFTCVFGLPYHILDKIWILNYTNDGVCKVMTFLIVSGSFSSVFVLLVVGLDRFLKVCRPLKRQIKDFGDRKACLIAIVLAVVVSSPQLILYGNWTHHNIAGYDEVNCFIDDDYAGTIYSTIYLGLNLLIFILSVLYLIIMYGFICKKIYDHDQMQGAIVLNKKKGFCNCTSGDDNEDELNEDEDANEENDIEMTNLRTNGESKTDGSSTKTKLLNSKPVAKKKHLQHVPSSAMVRHTAAGKKQEKNTRKITLMMLTITVVFIVAYLPVIMITIFDQTIEDYWWNMSEFEELLNDFFLRLYLINNVANPIIYCFWDKRFRKECGNVLRKLFCCKNKDDDRAHNSSSSSSRETQYTMAK